ncbi:MAG: serine protease [Planctomycetes bacterium]|nr:serine protease [Planctomycetota bacterium]
MTNSFARTRPRRAVLFGLFVASLCVLVQSASLRAADDALDADTLKKSKAATVRLKVTLPDNSVIQGSGFFGAGPNLVLTNAHVLGMLRDESRKPKKVEVIVHGGTADEKTYIGRVLGVDAGSDLGVLVVSSKDLPAPLALAPSRTEVLETQNVFIFGYPFGDDLGKTITVTKSTVSSSARKAPSGYTQIQLAGGLHPGNSGGPVLDAKGAVVGVAVSGIKGTQIHFAVPVGYVHSFLLGRTHRWFWGVPYKDGDTIKMPLSTMTYDPLSSVRTIRAEVWTGDPGPERTGPKSREALPGDSERVKTDLVYKAGFAQGDIALPELPKGKLYWLQLVTVKDKNEITLPGRPFRPQQLVERTPVVLGYKPLAWDPGKLLLNCDAELKIRDREGNDHSMSMKYQTDLVRETDGKAKPDGSTTAKLLFSNAKLTIATDGKEEAKSVRLQELLSQVDKVPTTVSINKEGEFLEFRPVVASLPAKDRNVMSYLVLQMAQGLDSTVIPLTGKEVTSDKPWTAKRDVLLSVAGAPELAVAELTFRYLGVRTVNGRVEAVIKAEGLVRGRKGEGSNIGGKMEVTSSVDVESGQVVSATARIDVDLDLTEDGASGLASGVYSVSLRRAPKAAPKP